MARERMTFVRVPEWSAQANTQMQRVVALADGSTRTDVKAIAATGTLTLTWPFTLLEVDTTGGNVTVTLPPLATVPGYRVDVKKLVAANTATIAAASGETIDGAGTQALTVQWSSRSLIAGAAGWRIV
jgi:hypothetical protein